MEVIYFEDLQEGQVIWGDELLVDPSDMLAYNRKYDPWPIHVDEEIAAQSPFGGVIASGGYTISLMYQSGHTAYNNERSQWKFLGGFDWKVRFPYPVRPNDHLRLKITIVKTTPSRKGGRGIVETFNEMFNQNDDLVLSIEVTCLVATRPE